MIDVSGFVIGRLVIITRYGTILDEKGTVVKEGKFRNKKEEFIQKKI